MENKSEFFDFVWGQELTFNTMESIPYQLRRCRWVIFGGAGFVGNELIKMLLAQNQEVVCVDNFYKGHADNLLNITGENFSFVRGDIRDSKIVEQVTKSADVVVNLAAIVGVPACNADSYNVDSVNTFGVQNILNEMPDNVTFIQASTDSVFGKVDVYCDETTTPNPQSSYGRSKLAAEKIIFNHPKNETSNLIAIRFSTGMGQSGNARVNLLVNDLVFTAIEQKVLTIFEPDVLRTFINVKDMASSIIHFGYLGLCDQNKHQLYCVGDNSLNYTKRALAEKIKEKVPCSIVYIDGKDPDNRNYQVNHARLEETGFKCMYSMDDTIDELIKMHKIISYQKKYQ